MANERQLAGCRVLLQYDCEWDSTLNQRAYPRTCDSRFARPFAHRHGPSIERQQSIFPRIVALLFSCSPSAITGLVVSIVVDSFKRVHWRRTLPHVGKEVVEGFQPAVANRDSTATVVFERLAFWSQAAALHSKPDGVLISSAGSVRAKHGRSCGFSFAIAASRPSSDKAGGINGSLCTALALTNPNGLFAALSAIRNYCPQSEIAAGKVFEKGIGRDRLSFNHDVSFQQKDASGQSRRTFARPFRLASLSAVSGISARRHPN